MVIIRPDPTQISPEYAHQLFKYLKSDFDVFATGSAQPQLPIRDLKEILVPLPTLPEQRAIAAVLSSLDDKIDLLHRQNKTLEGMASALWRRALGAKRVLTEVPFVTYLRPEDPLLECKPTAAAVPTILRGVVDLAFLEPDGWVIVEYKTDQATNVCRIDALVEQCGGGRHEGPEDDWEEEGEAEDWDHYEPAHATWPTAKLDALFERADAAFRAGDLALARDAYEKLLTLVAGYGEDGFDADEEESEPVGATDLEEAKARYLRALYETTELAQRPAALLKALQDLQYVGGPVGLPEVIGARRAPLPDREAFLDAWITLLRQGRSDQFGFDLEARRLLFQAVRMHRGPEGLAELARRDGRRIPEAYRKWVQVLAEESRTDEAVRAAQEALRAAGHTVVTSDLYAMEFDPVSDRRNFTTVKNPEFFKQQIEEMHATEVGGFASDVEAELRKMEDCDLMIWQFPLWWFGLPGILKGWADRAFAMGRTYGGERFYENGVFKGKRALLSVTTGGPEAVYQKGGWNGDIHAILRPIQRGILRFTGWDVLAPNIVYAPVRVSDEERQARLNGWAARLRNVEAEKPIEVGEY
jgi:NAD(P)H dehydrogenase (quinone)